MRDLSAAFHGAASMQAKIGVIAARYDVESAQDCAEAEAPVGGDCRAKRHSDRHGADARDSSKRTATRLAPAL